MPQFHTFECSIVASNLTNGDREDQKSYRVTYFPSGLLTGGSGATQVGLTYIYIRLLETYDLKGTLQILAVFTLVICVLAALTFLPTSQSAAVKTEDSGKTQDSRFHKYTAAVKNKRILVFIIAESVDCIAYAVSGVHQVWH